MPLEKNKTALFLLALDASKVWFDPVEVTWVTVELVAERGGVETDPLIGTGVARS